MARPTRLRIFDDGPRPGAVNMQRDAALLAAQGPGDPPVLRLYRWSPPAVSLGHHQRVGAFDAAAIAARGYGLVRRPTGGRAILHADELTYAVVGASPCPLFGASLHETYATINRALVRFLTELGLRPDVSAGESRAEARWSPTTPTARVWFPGWMPGDPPPSTILTTMATSNRSLECQNPL